MLLYRDMTATMYMLSCLHCKLIHLIENCAAQSKISQHLYGDNFAHQNCHTCIQSDTLLAHRV